MKQLLDPSSVVRYKRELQELQGTDEAEQEELLMGFVDDVSLAEVFGKYYGYYGDKLTGAGGTDDTVNYRLVSSYKLTAEAVNEAQNDPKVVRERDSDSAVWDLLTVAVTPQPLAFGNASSSLTEVITKAPISPKKLVNTFSRDLPASSRSIRSTTPRSTVSGTNSITNADNKGYQIAKFGENCHRI